ncbi:MAG: HAMP domain-containing histidine kinase, partial [Oscillospiraceae bacterium]|nr:HAMP domain-containing histidine kinase [Oscillospiraceae bacterium]
QLSQLARKNNSEEKKLLDMEQLIDTVLHVALPACPPGVSTERSSSLEGNCRVYGNETQLSQLFLNLMINAFHAMENSGGLLSIRFHTQQDTMLIQVQDSGCGIPEAALPHLFEPFFTTKEGGKGSGLGLAIAHQIVEDHHGSIEVQSKEGEGSCFTVRLPLYYN